jgi:nicotinamidase/pyrazinamidase
LHWAIKDVPVSARFYKGQYSAAYSGFEGTTSIAYGTLSLQDWLNERDITDVDVVGIATDYCVKATALDAAKLGFKTQVLLPYTAAVSPEGLATAIEDFKEAGVSVL